MKQNPTDTIAGLLQAMGISSPTVSIGADDFGTVYSVETPDGRLLIGNNGETLLALNHVVKRMLERKEGEEDFSVDVNGFQRAKNEELRAKARMYAERAKSFQTDVEMEPMSSYERMVVHAVLAKEPDIKTESSGFGRERKVVVKYVPRGAGVNI